MYSMVLIVSMAGAPEAPSFGWHKGCHGGCQGSHATVVVQHSSGCQGNSCSGGGHCMFGGKLRSCFSNLCHKSNSCHGGGGCHGGVVYSAPATGCGEVVIPPSHPVPTTPPSKETAPPAVPPKTAPPKVG